eukprot:gene11456-23961_t
MKYNSFVFVFIHIGICTKVFHAWLLNSYSPSWRKTVLCSSQLSENDLFGSVLDPVKDNQLKSKGHPHTPDSKAKISAANKGKPSWNTGQKHSEETKRKIAEKTRQAMFLRKEAKAKEMGMTIEEYDESRKKVVLEKKIAVKKGGLTEEGRKKISETLKKRWQNKEFRQSYTIRFTGTRNHSEETKNRISEAIKLKWKDADYRTKLEQFSPSQEVRNRISATLKTRWNDPTFRERMTNTSYMRTPEWKAAISKAIIEKWQDPDYRTSVLNAPRNFTRSSTSTPRRRSVPKPKLSDEDLLQQRLLAREAQKERKRIRLQAMKDAKEAARNKSKSIKDVLGGELWFEEK